MMDFCDIKRASNVNKMEKSEKIKICFFSYLHGRGWSYLKQNNQKIFFFLSTYKMQKRYKQNIL